MPPLLRIPHYGPGVEATTYFKPHARTQGGRSTTCTASTSTTLMVIKDSPAKPAAVLVKEPRCTLYIDEPKSSRRSRLEVVKIMCFFFFLVNCTTMREILGGFCSLRKIKPCRWFDDCFVTSAVNLPLKVKIKFFPLSINNAVSVFLFYLHLALAPFFEKLGLIRAVV